ncbi:pitrilysin family protein [Rhodococcus sp. X156]|uniref:M16 family metallopeptidase n=1 Tax=Rhodococcus sp. X156 TaxID=2499145 RepID=UPI000FDC76C6|nr:pitrilysin family protein [Rhodococcus sp. X156]
MTSPARTAEQIATTALGPRALPELGEQRAAAERAQVETVLDNGLRVLAVQNTSVPMVEIRLGVPFAGSEPTHPARAEVLSAALFAGTDRRDRYQVDTELAAVGADLSAGVDPEHLAVDGSVLAEGLPVLLDVLADVLTGATYPDREVDGERSRLVERLEVARSQPGVLAREALLHRAFGDHPSANEVPQAEDVAAVTAEQVRQLHAQAVVPRGSLLVLVGDLDPEDAVAQVRSALAGWTSEATAAVLPPWPAIAPADVLLVDRPGAVQSQIRLVTQGVSRLDETYPAAQLANLVFGGYFSSRLMENVREDKGYTYGASSGMETSSAGAILSVSLDTSRETTAAALMETTYELGRVVHVPPTDAEIASARQYAIGALSISLSTQSGLASTLARLLPLGVDADWVRTHPLRLAEVSNDDVRAAAARMFGPGRFTGIVQCDVATIGADLGTLGSVELPAAR